MARAPHNKNRKSRIRLLPKAIKSELDKLLREDRMTQADMLKQINALCEKHGEKKVSQSSLSRYQKKANALMQRTRDLREVSATFVAGLGDDPTSDVGKMLAESVRTLAADFVFNVEEGKSIDPKALNQIALVYQRVEQAEMTRHKREKELRREVAELAASKAEEALTNQGMTASTIETIKKEILGIA